MPVDGLGSDAGRQSLTEVRAAGARASRKLGASRALPAELPAAETPPVPDSPTPGSIGPRRPSPAAENVRGERLVALSALVVLAIAALFFVERIGGMPGAPVPPPVVPPGLEMPSIPFDPVVVPPQTGSGSVTGPTGHAVPAPAPRFARTQVRARSTPIASTRKPQGKAIAKAEPPTVREPLMVASAELTEIESAERSRWERMDDEIAACAGHASFLDAVVCDQRARHRYCDDWWGRTDACPSGRTADYGN
jgi:hypothetical protein